MSEPNPSTDSPLNAEEEAEWRARDGWCSCDEYRNSDYGRLFATLDAARAAHPESRPDPDRYLRERIEVLVERANIAGNITAAKLRAALDAHPMARGDNEGWDDPALASPIPTDRPERCPARECDFWLPCPDHNEPTDQPEPIDEERLMSLRGQIDKAIATIDDPEHYIEVDRKYRAGWVDGLRAVHDDPAIEAADAILAAYRTEPGETT